MLGKDEAIPGSLRCLLPLPAMPTRKLPWQVLRGLAFAATVLEEL